MTTEIQQPITTTDLRKLIHYQVPKPGDGEERHVTVIFHWDEELAGWVVHSLNVNQDGESRVRAGPLHPQEARTPLLTQLRKEKRYKTMEALFRDIKAIAGRESKVILWEK